jgi:hypothetical protein
MGMAHLLIMNHVVGNIWLIANSIWWLLKRVIFVWLVSPSFPRVFKGSNSRPTLHSQGPSTAE